MVFPIIYVTPIICVTPYNVCDPFYMSSLERCCPARGHYAHFCSAASLEAHFPSSLACRSRILAASDVQLLRTQEKLADHWPRTAVYK